MLRTMMLIDRADDEEGDTDDDVGCWTVDFGSRSLRRTLGRTTATRRDELVFKIVCPI